jgi:hypothetical protein
MGGMYTDRAPAFAFVQASPKRPGAPSIAALSRWVGCTRTTLLLSPSFRPAPNARVPHPSRPHRDGWDVHRPRRCFWLRSGQPKTPGCPIHRGPIAMGGMYTDRAAAFAFVPASIQASPKRRGAPSIAALSRWVGCTRTARLLLPSFLLLFRPAPNARVPIHRGPIAMGGMYTDRAAPPLPVILRRSGEVCFLHFACHSERSEESRISHPAVILSGSSESQ